MYYIAICDDDPSYLDYLENAIKQVNVLNDGIVAVYKYASGHELINDFDKGINFELVIIDIAMEGIDGNETARLFRKQYPTSELVFCSGVYLPTVKSFEPNPRRYLLKSYDDKKMQEELTYLLKLVKNKHDIRDVAIPFNTSLRYIQQDDILYVHKRKHGCELTLYTPSTNTFEKLKCNKSLSEIYNQVDHGIFAYPHSSYFVNMNYITKVTYQYLILLDDIVLTITRSKTHEFRNEFAKYSASLNGKEFDDGYVRPNRFV